MGAFQISVLFVLCQEKKQYRPLFRQFWTSKGMSHLLIPYIFE